MGAASGVRRRGRAPDREAVRSEAHDRRRGGDQGATPGREGSGMTTTQKKGAMGYYSRLGAKKERPLYLKTGWPSVDMALNGGFVPGQSVSVQGFTNVAKTNFLANAGLNMAEAGN